MPIRPGYPPDGPKKDEMKEASVEELQTMKLDYLNVLEAILKEIISRDEV